MESALCLFTFKRLFFLLSCFYLITMRTNSSSTSMQPQCHEDESSALLQFKHSFIIRKFVSSDPSAYPKAESWKLKGEYSDCCSWHGVKCDVITGHVIELDLSSSFLYGAINSSSSLFSLVHLQRLNLADNHFNYSEIPSQIRHLSRLTSLNLSSSAFCGQIPSEILELSNLASLDLSHNLDGFYNVLLKLENPSLKTLVQNLTNLKELYLTSVNIYSTVPDILANLSSLTGLVLEDCGLYGELPRGIFLLPQLETLNAGKNLNLTSHLPEFHNSSSLKYLALDGTNFSGKLPNSIGNLESLNYLDMSRSNLTGTLPASLGNLIQLTFLDLRSNNFRGQIPSFLANLSQLTFLSVCENNFDPGALSLPLWKLPKLTKLYFSNMNIQGEIPLSLANLTQLSFLDFSGNQLVGQIPSWLMNLTQLTTIKLRNNQVHGTIPSSISQLKQLEYLAIEGNRLSGAVDLDIFLELRNLIWLQLSQNKLTALAKGSTANATLPKLNVLGLGSCNLREFPDFLRFQYELEVLLLNDNNILGPIPTWVWNSSKETLEIVNLHHNFLTGFEQHQPVIPWHSLQVLDLSSNRLRGSLPIPPPSTRVYKVRDNLVTGEIPPSICHVSSLLTLDLSNNNLSGTIPQCLADFLLVLNLSHNSLHGNIPPAFMMDSKLMMIDLSHNQLQGQVPRSLANCSMLEMLVLENNRIEDTFPSWLGSLLDLQVLVLRFNKFHGAIDNPKTSSEFPKLRIIDLSHNGFSGNLPSEYFRNWNAMNMGNVEKLTYMQALSTIQVMTAAIPRIHMSMLSEWSENYSYSIIMHNKGTQRLYEKIQTAFVAVDLSNNKFSGEIPESLGSLNGLQLLDLSNNNLTGGIPSSLAKMAGLESLDLSENMLSGEIPQQLTLLTFLAFLNVSHNHLAGPIPRGNQFDTFENISYDGNSELCGNPLSKLCGNPEASTPPPSSDQHSDDSEFPSGVDWIVIFMGYGGGLVVGLVTGYTLTTKYHEWFVDTFGRGLRK